MQESSSRLLERIHACPKHASLRERFAAAQEAINAEFRQRVHNLAPELYDMIYDYTFKIHRHTTFVDLLYRPPSIMAVDRRSRMAARKTYYLNTIFTFDHQDLCKMWLKRLDSRSRRQIRCLRISLENTVYRRGCGWRYLETVRDLDLECRHIMRELDEMAFLTVHLLEVGAKLPGDTEMSWSSNPARDWAEI
ncbi:hypothetical protein Tdes44962_MAKER06814 [Teratosphaeria destructans]|uniref:Uncharacterized protein n=1 Tax=Teratosphaeria destructans TaxID=418781 RepID=A0A9W7T134_9PEZI|nr:hypothetical protein Tdes44962_MAKER06814 [Teratosphaeria destructans]